MDDPFTEEIIAFLPNLKRYAMSLCGRPDLAEDLVQITVERAFRGREGFDPETRLQAWLLRILRNAWIDMTRRNRTQGVQTPIEDSPALVGEDGAQVAEARRVEAAIAADPTLAAQVEMFRQTGRRLSALAATQDDSISDALLDRVRAMAAGQAGARQAGAGAAPEPAATDQPAPASSAGEVVDLATKRQNVPASQAAAPRRAAIWQVPLAASIFLAIGLWGGSALEPDLSDEPDRAQLAMLDSDMLHAALRSASSGARQPLEGGGEVTIISSFHNAEGQFCREVEIGWPDRPTVVSVACHAPGIEADGWATQLAILAPPADDQGYAPASSLETLDAYLAAIGAGAPLSDEEEAAALSALN